MGASEFYRFEQAFSLGAQTQMQSENVVALLLITAAAVLTSVAYKVRTTNLVEVFEGVDAAFDGFADEVLADLYLLFIPVFAQLSSLANGTSCAFNCKGQIFFRLCQLMLSLFMFSHDMF